MLPKVVHLQYIIKDFVNYILVFSKFNHLRRDLSFKYKMHNSYLGQDGRYIFLQRDRIIKPFVNRYGHWDINLVVFISNIIKSSSSKKLFIDIGANQGLISMQILNMIENVSNVQFICVEPVKKYFINLKLNIENTNEFNRFTLHNFGLGSFENLDKPIYFTKRNATASLHPDLVVEPIVNLKTENVKIISVTNFIENYLPSTKIEIVIKSDTDGSDIEIFNLFMNSKISHQIICYTLELILSNISDISLIEFIQNCNKFNNWNLMVRNGKKIENKMEILRRLQSKEDFIGDLYLSILK
jgi:FkbM family methyltransferase